MKFAELLKYHMDKRGLSQYGLAMLTGIPQATISRWIRDEFLPSLDKVYLICEKLGISVAEFFSINGPVETTVSNSPETDGYISAITRSGESLTPDLAKAFFHASEDQANRRKHLHKEIDRLLDEYEAQKHD